MIASAQVVDAVAALLEPIAPLRVFVDRAHPLNEDEIPAWLIDTGDEERTEVAIHGEDQEHSLEIFARAVIRAGSDTLKDDLRAVQLQGEQALFGSEAPYQLICEGVERSLGQEGDHAVHRVSLRLRATYVTDRNDPESIISS